MNTKLTLRLDKEVIERAKDYANSKNLSLSAMVENYFRFLSENKNPQIEITPIVKELSGILELPNNFDVKQEFHVRISEKCS